MLRIDFWNIAFIIINLLVLYLFMKHFLMGPVMKIVDERRQMVEKDLDDAAAAREEAGRMKAQYEAAAANADQEAAAVIREARERAQAEYDRILEQARADAEKKQEDARKAIAMEQERAMEEMKHSVAGLAMTAAARLLSGRQNAGGNPIGYEELLEKAAETGEKNDGAGKNLRNGIGRA